jgi:hypothetical protein
MKRYKTKSLNKKGKNHPTDSLFSLVGLVSTVNRILIYLPDICKQSYHCFHFCCWIASQEHSLFLVHVHEVTTFVHFFCPWVSQSTLLVIGCHSQHSLSSVVTVNTLCHRLSQSTLFVIGCHNQHSLPSVVTVNTFCHSLSQSTLSVTGMHTA